MDFICQWISIKLLDCGQLYNFQFVKAEPPYEQIWNSTKICNLLVCKTYKVCLSIKVIWINLENACKKTFVNYRLNILKKLKKLQ